MWKEFFANTIFFMVLGYLLMTGHIISATTGTELFSVGWKLITFRGLCSLLCWLPCEDVFELICMFFIGILEDM